jgi:hypothetical protein
VLAAHTAGNAYVRADAFPLTASNSLAPSAAVGPAFCWLPACQMDDNCVFVPLEARTTKCPSICFQQVASNQVSMVGNQANYISVGNAVQACNFPGPKLTPSAFGLAQEIVVYIRPGATGSIVLTVTNSNVDPKAPPQPYAVQSTLAPLLQSTQTGSFTST